MNYKIKVYALNKNNQMSYENVLSKCFVIRGVMGKIKDRYLEVQTGQKPTS